ncbi:hypothetical protein EV175_003450 [Coemansia sp. RSA 1933]|nr:hypothetical protein EV175_003450 [Coemansia sp. RSA 1933]
MATACTPSGSTVRWTAGMEFPDRSISAVAGIAQTKALAGAAPVALEAKLRLLKRVRLASVPAVLLTRTVLGLYVNTEAEQSHRYVNGLVAQLAKHPQCAAVLARLEATGDTSVGLADPFASSRSAAAAEAAALPPWIPTSRSATHALVYVAGHRLVLHLLASHACCVELMAAATAGCEASGDVAAESKLSSELAFIEQLEKQRHAETHERIQRTLSAESMVLAGPASAQAGGSLSRRRRQSHRRSRIITMTDVERLATPDEPDDDAESLAADDDNAEEADGRIEAANKRLAKQLIIAALKDRGIARSHPEFAALWSQIYRSLKFALRDNISRRRLSVRGLRAETTKHTAFYCSS